VYLPQIPSPDPLQALSHDERSQSGGYSGGDGAKGVKAHGASSKLLIPVHECAVTHKPAQVWS